jgi:ATP-dependent helicase/nuclease subunit B
MRPAIFSIAAGQPFLDTLVAGLMARAGDDPLVLARQTILLPTRRAVRSLREAFLRAGAGRPLLLPRLVPVGDLDAEEMALLGEAETGSDGAGADLPPAVPGLRRQLMLTRLVLAWGRAQGSGPATLGQAASLAGDLARFLDETQTEGKDLAGLATLAPEEHALHWQRVLDFLDILRVHWPVALAELGALDPGERRNRVLAEQRRQWIESPPGHPVIAAGITGGVPAVADLIATVARLPHGMVVLPGLDTLDDASWDEVRVDPAHPQHLLIGLLDRLEVPPAQVRPWPAPPTLRADEARRRLVAEALRPAAGSHRWRSIDGLDASSLDGVSRLDCAGPQEEAQTIALLLRERLTKDGETAALVTGDRALARRVAAELGRWGIDIDDSAGIKLNQTAPGVFLRLLLDAVAEDLAPVPLLALLKHPFAAGGAAPAVFRATVRALELAVLRGPRPAPGIDGLRRAAAATPGRRALLDLLDRLDRAVAPLVAALAQDAVPLARLVAAHIDAVEALAATDEAPGAAQLWREPAGEAAADFLSELLQAACDFPPLDGGAYAPLFETMIAGPVVRPPFGRHPRLFIWGPLEARLQQADLIVLGGLNEGVWPPETESDPWLSRPMRKAFGMPAPERRVGQAAHDFAQALQAPTVVLTRADRIEGTPTRPSRWLLRLETVLRAAGLDRYLPSLGAPVSWQTQLDDPGHPPRPIEPPAPRPPVAARPRSLAVTDVETWMRDPYGLYARKILRLRALDPLDADPGAAERGEFIHRALDDFVRRFPDALPDEAEATLLALGREAFGAALERPGVRAFWWPRFERIARWFLVKEAERRPLLSASRTELKGRLSLEGGAAPFELIAKADRIDRRRDGGLAILDYKTGTVPDAQDVALGFSPQLPLEAAMAAAGGFAGIDAAPVTELAFWRLSGGDPAGEVKPVAKDAAALGALAAEALAGLRELVRRFDDRATPYRAVPRPERAPRYSDYAHLARIKEWSVAAERDE